MTSCRLNDCDSIQFCFLCFFSFHRIQRPWTDISCECDRVRVGNAGWVSVRRAGSTKHPAVQGPTLLYFRVCLQVNTFTLYLNFSVKTKNYILRHGKQLMKKENKINNNLLCSSMANSLTVLDLSANFLDEIPFTAFKTLKVLEWLNLGRYASYL